jgi:hypothetical protein
MPPPSKWLGSQAWADLGSYTVFLTHFEYDLSGGVAFSICGMGWCSQSFRFWNTEDFQSRVAQPVLYFVHQVTSWWPFGLCALGYLSSAIVDICVQVFMGMNIFTSLEINLGVEFLDHNWV